MREEFDGQFPDGSVQVAELISSELVTNAVKYGADPVVLTVHDGDGYLHVEVEDGGQPFEPQADAASASGGIGLQIVSSLAENWGIQATDRGVLVWAKISSTQTMDRPRTGS